MLTDLLSPGSQYSIHNLHRRLIAASRRSQWPMWPLQGHSPGGPMLLVHAPDRTSLRYQSVSPSGNHSTRRPARSFPVRPQTPPATSRLPPLGRPPELRSHHPRGPERSFPPGPILRRRPRHTERVNSPLRTDHVGGKQSLDDRQGTQVRRASTLGHTRVDVAGMHRDPPSGHGLIRDVLVSRGAEASCVDPLSTSLEHD